MGINLDGVDESELWQFWGDYHRCGRNKARALFPDQPAAPVRVCRDLANYAANKATAMGCRNRGDITGAADYERIADRIYERLPTFARW